MAEELKDDMPRERYNFLSTNMDEKLTSEEVARGYIFCICNWDGLLIHITNVEARYCSCLKDKFPGVVKDG